MNESTWWAFLAFTEKTAEIGNVLIAHHPRHLGNRVPAAAKQRHCFLHSQIGQVFMRGFSRLILEFFTKTAVGITEHLRKFLKINRLAVMIEEIGSYGRIMLHSPPLRVDSLTPLITSTSFKRESMAHFMSISQAKGFSR